MDFGTSDLHYGLNPRGDRATRRLADFVVRSGRASDVLLLGGDIGTDDESIAACCHLFQNFKGRRVAVPGNHDIGVSDDTDSWTRYIRVQGILADNGFHPIEVEPIHLPDRSIVGTMGWYDYSFSDAALGFDNRSYLAKRYPGDARPCWYDAYYARWGLGDQEMTELQLERLARQIDSVPDGRDITVLMHFVPTDEHLFRPRWMVPKRWRFMNAFLGSNRFRELFARHERRIRTVVNGHIHRASTVVRGQIRYVSIGGSYEHKQLVLIDDGQVRRQCFRG